MGFCTLQGPRTAIFNTSKEKKFIPYQEIADLPDSVKDHLPKHAQEIFRAAFNNAQEEYDEEERVFRVAWSAVKRDYEKGNDGQWHKKPE